jgi:NurA-like 5'-3' nuclease
MKNEQKFKVGQTVLIDGHATGKGNLEGKIIEHSLVELDGKNYYLIRINGQQTEYVAEKFLSVPGAHQDTNTLDNLYSILNAMDEIAHIDRSDYFNAYMSEVRQRIKEVETLNELGKLPS